VEEAKASSTRLKMQRRKTRIQFAKIGPKPRRRRNNRLAFFAAKNAAETSPNQTGRPESKSNPSKLRTYANATAMQFEDQSSAAKEPLLR
jgi:hypothetical protein